MPFKIPTIEPPAPRDKALWEYPLDLLDFLNRPLYALSGAITALQEGAPELVLSRAWKGLSAQERRTGSDILANVGMKPGWGRTIAGLALDTPMSYATLPGFGHLSKLGKMGRMLGRTGKLGVAGVAARTTRFKRLGQLLEAGRDVSKFGLGPQATKGVGRQLAKSLAAGKTISPLGRGLAEQAALGQRNMITLLGGRIPLIKGSKALETIGKGTGWLAKTKAGKAFIGIFKETTGNPELDDVVFGAGGTKDLYKFYSQDFYRHGVPLVGLWDDATKNLSPEDVQAVTNALHYGLEPVGKAPLKLIKAKYPEYEAFLVGTKLKMSKLPPHLKHLRPKFIELQHQMHRTFKRMPGMEKAHELPGYMREYFMPHHFTEEFREATRNMPGLMQRISETIPKGYHRGLDKLLLTGEGNVAEINAMFATGDFLPELQAIAKQGVKILEDNPITLYIKRAQISASTIAGSELVKGVKILADKTYTPLAYTRGRIAQTLPKGKSAVALHPKHGLLGLDEYSRLLLEQPAKKMSYAGWKILTMDDELAKAVITHRKIITNPDAMQEAANAVIKAYDVAHSWLRRWTLGIFPGWMIRNEVGNLSAMWYAGMRPGEMGKYIGLTGRLQLALAHGADDIIMVGGRAMSGKQFARFASKYGILERGWYGQMLKSLTDPTTMTTRKGVPILSRALRGGFAINRAFENNVRVGMFWWALDKGMAPKEAARMVKKFLFDYTSLSTAERKVFHRAAFFYTWIRKNLPLQLETYLTNPAKISPLAAAQREFMKGQGLKGTELPDWAQRAMAFPFARRGEQVTGFALGSYFPFGDLQEAFMEPGKKLAGAVSPLLRAPVEAEILNKNLYFGREIEQYPGQKREFLGMMVPAKLAHYMSSFRPAATAARFVAKERSTAGVPGEVARFLIGTRTYKWDIGREQARRKARTGAEARRWKAMYRWYKNKGYERTAADIKVYLERLGETVE